VEAIQNVNPDSLLDTLISLTTAFVLGGVIRFERQYRQRTAGLRTNSAGGGGRHCVRGQGDRGLQLAIYLPIGLMGFLGIIQRALLVRRGTRPCRRLWWDTDLPTVPVRETRSRRVESVAASEAASLKDTSP
jgi:putative Mg2+ transporter-C (MgtC) family protein